MDELIDISPMLRKWKTVKAVLDYFDSVRVKEQIPPMTETERTIAGKWIDEAVKGYAQWTLATEGKTVVLVQDNEVVFHLATSDKNKHKWGYRLSRFLFDTWSVFLLMSLPIMGTAYTHFTERGYQILGWAITILSSLGLAFLSIWLLRRR